MSDSTPATARLKGKDSIPTAPKRRRVALHLSLHYAFFASPDIPGQLVAYCSDLDVCAEAASRRMVQIQLRRAIVEYFETLVLNREMGSVLRPTAPGIIPDHAEVEVWQVLVILELKLDRPYSVEVLFPPRAGEFLLSQITTYA
jgi:hypothetical protein